MLYTSRDFCNDKLASFVIKLSYFYTLHGPNEINKEELLERWTPCKQL